MTVVADSSPLIFLSKIDRLGLLKRLYDNRLVIPAPVKVEVLRPEIQSDDSYILEKFIGECTVQTFPRPRCFARALSTTDNAVLTLAIRRKAERLLVDERLLRRIAEAEGIAVTGTIGILYAAVRADFLSPTQGQADLRKLVRHAGFRISIAVYEAAMDAFQGRQVKI